MSRGYIINNKARKPGERTSPIQGTGLKRRAWKIAELTVPEKTTLDRPQIEGEVYLEKLVIGRLRAMDKQIEAIRKEIADKQREIKELEDQIRAINLEKQVLLDAVDGMNLTKTSMAEILKQQESVKSMIP